MDDMHVTRELYRAVEQGELPGSFLDEVVTDHLMARCPHCRAEIAAYSEERQAGPAAWSRLLQMFGLLAERLLAPSAREQRRARLDFEELLSLPPEERPRRLARARSRFRSAALVRLLLDESWSHIPRSPAEAFQYAELAQSVADRNPRMADYFALHVLATVAMANACRILGDSRRADELFLRARQIILEHGVTDLSVIARVDDLVGSLRRDQRRLPEAAKLQRRAATLFSLRKQWNDAARALINLGAVCHHQDQGDQAIEATRTALGLLSPDAEPRLHLCAHHNLAFYLTEAGRYDEAEDLLEAGAPLYRKFAEPWTDLRVLWLRGDIAAGRGDTASAEEAYRQTRDGFVAQQQSYDAALVSLDLAALYLQEGRTADVRRLAEEMLSIFQSEAIHREALAALQLFQEAARRDELTVEKARKVAAYLREARTGEARGFSWGGGR